MHVRGNNKPHVDLPEIDVDRCPLKENTRGWITEASHTVFQNGYCYPYSGYYDQLDYDERSVYYASRRLSRTVPYEVTTICIILEVDLELLARSIFLNKMRKV